MIVELVPRHAPECVEVIGTLPEWFGYPGASEGVAEAAENQKGFVALEDGVVVGFVTTLPIFAETLEITYLAVRADRRRRGLGRRLVAAACGRAVTLGASSVTLLTARPESADAPYAATVAFYRSLGFWRTKDLRNADWGGATSLVMTAPVAQLAAGTAGSA